MGSKPPPVPSEAERNKRRVSIIFSCLTGAVLVFLLFVLMKVVPTFADVFASFGSQLPLITALVFKISGWVDPHHNHLGHLLLGLAVYVLILLPLQVWKGLSPLYAIGLFMTSVLFLIFIVGSLFIPMFELGNAVKS